MTNSLASCRETNRPMPWRARHGLFYSVGLTSYWRRIYSVVYYTWSKCIPPSKRGLHVSTILLPSSLLLEESPRALQTTYYTFSNITTPNPQAVRHNILPLALMQTAVQLPQFPHCQTVEWSWSIAGGQAGW
eukprot:2470042-Pyramimonas_sp.AAC.1